MKYAYIIGPYGADPTLNRSEKNNTLVAEHLAKKAYAEGFTPFVPHSMIFSGIFGSDSDPLCRKKGERATLSLLAMFMKQPNVELWVIADYIYNSWIFSPGTQKELQLWKKKRGNKDIRYFLYYHLDQERKINNAENMAHQ